MHNCKKASNDSEAVNEESIIYEYMHERSVGACGRHRENSAYAKGNSTARKVIGSMDARSV